MNAADKRPIRRLLISLYHKEVLDEWAPFLRNANIEIYSTGGTLNRLRHLGVPAESIETLTGYPAILGGRVKTLHPQVMGAVLMDETLPEHCRDAERYDLSSFDAVVVDLYPFREAIWSEKSEQALQELIDIGGITLIRAAAKNYRRVCVIPHRQWFPFFREVLERRPVATTVAERRIMAGRAFAVSATYDLAISSYLSNGEYRGWIGQHHLPHLRYGENPHQQAGFYRESPLPWVQHHGKPLSYNNILDLHHAISLLHEWTEVPAFAVIKHTNPCGIAVGDTIEEAARKALEGDTLSAFGGILVSNHRVTAGVARLIGSMFFEVMWAPDYDSEALALLSRKKRIILSGTFPMWQDREEFRSALGGILWQASDVPVDDSDTWKVVTQHHPSDDQLKELMFAWKVVKHLKSNAIAVVRSHMLIGAGHGQTSRVDAVEHALLKARSRGHVTSGSVAASDAFFPFPDGVERLIDEGITAIIQPGGSIRDAEIIEACDRRNIAMIFTGKRHFRH